MGAVDTLGPIITAVAAGGAGVATGTVVSEVDVDGLVLAVYVEYLDTPPASSDVVVETVGTDPVAPAETILTLANNNTNVWKHPRLNIDDPNGVEQGGIWDYFPIKDKVRVTLSQANDGDQVRVWLKVWRN